MRSLACKVGAFISLLLTTIISCGYSHAFAAEKADSLNKSVGVSVRSTLAELNDFRPGYLYLTVENRLDIPLAIDRIVIAERPPFISIKLSSIATDSISSRQSALPFNDSTPLPAHEVRVYPLYISSTGQVRPGDHMLLFNIFFKRTVNGKLQSGSVLAEHKFKVKVFGENEILGALSNTVTFLIFPGIIILVLAGLTWKAFVPSPWKEKFPEFMKGAVTTDVRFLVTAITVSLLMVWQGYPFLTQYFTKTGRRDYLYGYGFMDIVRLWLFSVMIGITFSVIMAGLVWLWQKYIQLEETDKPVDLLRKMLKNGINSVELQRVTLTASNEKGFLIDSVSTATKEFLIIPIVDVIWQKDAHTLYDKFDKKINGDSPSSLRSILDTLDKGLKQNKAGTGLLVASWLQLDGFIKAPQKIEKENFVVDSEKESFIRHRIER